MKQIILVGFLFFRVVLNGQQAEYVDFKTASVDVRFGDLSKKEVEGAVSYQVDILKETDSIYIDAKNFDTISYILDDSISGELYTGKHLIIKHPFKSGGCHKIDVVWKTKPKKALYFIDWDIANSGSSSDFKKDVKKGVNQQIWSQGQGKYTSNWLPSLDDTNDKIEFDLTITFKKGFEVITNGKLIEKTVVGDEVIWHYDMQQPMSSYLVALAIGKYYKKEKESKSRIPLELYYYPEDSLKAEPTYRYTKRMFDFFEEEIGVRYPWQNYKQIPVKDFLYAGMENTSTTIFSDAFVIDSIAFIDKNYVNVNAHELAHQWFGDLVTAKSSEHHWLQEGFATYYALLAERKIFGDTYYYWRLYEYAQELLDQDRMGQSTALLDPKSSSTTFYKKGAWVLHLLREEVGDKAFKKAVRRYLEKHQFKNVETVDFITEVEQASHKKLDKFVSIWLEDATFYYDKVLESLKKSVFIQEYLMVDCEAYTSKCKGYLASGISDEAKIKIVSQMPNRLQAEDFINSVKVRQAIAKNLTKMPEALKSNYELLLLDKSYLTIEIALYQLWVKFPKDRVKYLNKTKGITGFNDNNVRILWLALALITERFEPENNALYFQELTNYTSPGYGFEIRQKAFQYLNEIQACNEVCQDNLQQATKHHNWRFSKFAKAMLAKK